MKITWKQKLLSLSAIAIIAIVLLSLFVTSGAIQISGKGIVSIQTNVALAAQISPTREPIKVQQIGDTVEQTSWGYRYTLEKGDIVEVGDSTTTDFKANIKTIRGDKWFSLGWAGGTFTPTLVGNTVSFTFNNNIDVSIYPVSPCDRLPDGGIEYDVTLKRRISQSTVAFDVNWSGITWQKVYGLNVEYTEARCEDLFGIEAAPYAITATSITGSDNVIYKTRQEYEVNSYLGKATVSTTDTSNYGINSNNGLPMSYTNLSTTYLYIHRGQMTDALGNKAWVEDINLNEAQKTLTFSLPSAWLRNATYPVHGVCGVDPAYAEQMASWLSDGYGGSDGVWHDYDIFSGKSVPKGAVAEIILSNSTTGTENTLGVRTDGSALDTRYSVLHEAEGGGQTHCRMFVTVHATTGLIECYHSDVSDADYFYLVGYWQNVTFTEVATSSYGSSATWAYITFANGASCVHHVLLYNSQADTANTIGIRFKGSSLERSILVHEPESGGANFLDMFVKADANKQAEFKATGISGNLDFGYFGTEMDFVQLWQLLTESGSAWEDFDLSSYLDQDGRICDFLLAHKNEAITSALGARTNGSGLTRLLTEHESESAGAGGEYTGFSMSAQSDVSGIVDIAVGASSSAGIYLAGYFKPTSSVNISVNTSSRTIMTGSVVAVSSTYYSYSGSTTPPSWPLADGECYFYVSNDGTLATDIYIHGHNWTGGVGWTLTTGSPGANQVRIYWFDSGDGSGDGTVVNTSDTQVLDELAASAHEHFDLKVETGSSFSDGAAKSGIVTITGVID